MARQIHARRFVAALGFAAGAAALLSGCSTADSVRSNPTPDLTTMSQTPDDVSNHLSYVVNTNLRQANEDLGRFMLFDRPSRLMNRATPY